MLEVNHPRSGTFGYFEQIHMDPLTGIVTNPDWSSDFEAVEAVTSKSLTNAELRDWWNLLNLGRRVTGVGNTDTHSVFAHELGWPRTFIQVGTDARPPVYLPDRCRTVVCADSSTGGQSSRT